MLSVIIASLLIFYVLLLFLPAVLLLILVNKKEYIELPEGQKYAGFWHRVWAGLIDFVILYISSWIFSFGFGFMILANVSYEVYMYWTYGIGIVWIFVYLFYYVLFQMSSKQATLGMMVVGIKIYDEELNRVGFWRLTGRYFTTGLSNIILWIGFFMIGWTERKQGLHDIVARTIHLKK
tara:strand:- start:44 stop:580 length:537 start_codon:yes stop_codon:yes gene_type:complete